MLSICLSVYLFSYLSIYIFSHLFIYLSIFCSENKYYSWYVHCTHNLSIFLDIIYFFIFSSINLFVYTIIYLSIPHPVIALFVPKNNLLHIHSLSVIFFYELSSHISRSACLSLFKGAWDQFSYTRAVFQAKFVEGPKGKITSL